MSDRTLTEDDGIAVLTFARPPRNFLSFATITELGETLACAARVAARSALPRLVGPGRALELVLTARHVAADEAAPIGLVEVPDDGLLEAAIVCARDIASQPRSALVAAKRAVNDGVRLPLSEGLGLEAQLFAECLSDPATLAMPDRVRERYRGTPLDVPVRF